METNDLYHIGELEDKILETISSYVRLNVPRPFGLLLSGGFDSGLLAAITKPDFVFTIRFPYGVKYDESRYCDAIIDHLGLRSKTYIIEPTKENFEEYAPEAIRAMGETVTHFSLVPFYMVMKIAADRMKEQGVVPHILSGEGPDEYLGGYARQIIFDELEKLYKIPELRNYHPTINKVTGHNLVAQYAKMMGYPDERARIYEEFWESGDLPLQGAIGKMDMELGVIEKMEQKMADVAGVKLHYPYIHPDFSEYCYHLPDNLKIRNGVTKWAFRQVCKKYLPLMMQDRTKMGGPVAPINVWLGSTAKGDFDKTLWLDYQKGVLNGK